MKAPKPSSVPAKQTVIEHNKQNGQNVNSDDEQGNIEDHKAIEAEKI